MISIINALSESEIDEDIEQLDITLIQGIALSKEIWLSEQELIETASVMDKIKRVIL